jgi:undecaprenyl diphosphate synthase
MMELKQQIDTEHLPQHIAVIMDGNGRWAQSRGQERLNGHQNAIKAVRDTVEACTELGIKYLTLYTFSTENWNRPQAEVSGLMELLSVTISNETETLLKNGVRLNAIGDIEALPEATYRQLKQAIADTSKGENTTLTLALSYSGRWDITQAMRKMAQDAADKRLDPKDINQDTIKQYLATAGMPDPELLIRTSGELRISNFLLWQTAYTELYFTNTLWPDFNKDELYKAIIDYQHRERRFGKTSEQVIK